MKTNSLSLIPSTAGGITISGATFTSTGAIISPSATGAEIKEILRAATMAMHASYLWAADGLAAAENARITGKLSDEECSELLTQMDFNYAATSRAMAVASVPHALRRGKLSPAHLAIIGRSCHTFDLQEKWASIALEEELSPRELRTSILAGEVKRTSNVCGHSTETATMVLVHLRRFKNQLLQGRDESDIDQAEALCLLDELKEVVSFIRTLSLIAAQDTCI